MIDQNQRREDLEEADRLSAAADSLKGSLSDDLRREAAELRAKWQPVKELVALAEVSAGARESDLAEADRLSAVAASLRPGSSSRAAVEEEVDALRAKWPDFQDDESGQVRRLGAYLLARGLAGPDVVPARAILDRIAELEERLASKDKAPINCHGCGLPIPNAGPRIVNTSLIAAIKQFEIDADFREQVMSGQIKPGQSPSPWVPTAAPHRGPHNSESPCKLSNLILMIQGDKDAAPEIGPKLSAVLKDRNVHIQSAPKKSAKNGHAQLPS